MLTTRQIRAALTGPPTVMHRGSLTFMAQHESGYGTAADPAHRRLIDDLLAEPVASQPTKYAHPAQDRAATSKRTGDGSLSPAELAWLGRIPADPAQVPFADARQLAALAAAVSPMAHPTDARLVENVWGPVRDWHDRNAAKVELANAQAWPTSAVPASAVPAMAKAIAAETPALTADEATARAGQAVRDAAERRRANRDSAITTVQQRIERLDQAIADRLAPVP